MELVLNPTGYDDTRIIYFIVDRISQKLKTLKTVKYR